MAEQCESSDDRRTGRPTFFLKFNVIVSRGYRELGAPAVAVLLVFLKHGDADDVAYITPETVARDLGHNKRLIQRRIAVLTRTGWLRTVGNAKGGAFRSARRQVCVPAPADARRNNGHKPKSARPGRVAL